MVLSNIPVRVIAHRDRILRIRRISGENNCKGGPCRWVQWFVSPTSIVAIDDVGGEGTALTQLPGLCTLYMSINGGKHGEAHGLFCYLRCGNGWSSHPSDGRRKASLHC